MRRVVVSLVTALLGAALLSSCGPSQVSYNDGFAVGQSLAAAAGPHAYRGHTATVRCHDQWRVSGPASDDRKVWEKGCVAGIRQMEATIGG